MESSRNSKRIRSDSVPTEFDSPEAKRLLHALEETETETESYTAGGQDLDSFIQSFENEISPPPESVDRTSGSGESKPDLEFLLEASDDELGLPPTDATTTPTDSETIPVSTASVEVEFEDGMFSWLDDQISNYGAFEYGFNYADGDGDGVSNVVEYVALDRLFDYADVGFGSSDLPRLPESLPAQ